MVDEFIALSMPFVFSIVIQLLSGGVQLYAKRSLRSSLSDEVSLSISPGAQQIGVDLAVQIYTHLGFVFGILASSVTCIAYTIRTQRSIIAAAGAVALLCLIPWWLIYWQGLSAHELQSSKGRPMKVWKWITIFTLWMITIYARLYPASK
jgi:hypothetical protein